MMILMIIVSILSYNHVFDVLWIDDKLYQIRVWIHDFE